MCLSSVNRRMAGTMPTVEIVMALPPMAVPDDSERIRAAWITPS